MNILDYLRSLRDTLEHPYNRHHPAQTIARIIFWKINQWCFHLPVMVELVPGIKCLCYPGSSYGGMVVYNRWAEYEIMKNITANLQRDSVYIDVGANIGDTTVIAASCTKGKIYAFEPSPVAYPRLLENIALNNLRSQITPEKMILASRMGVLSFSEMTTSETSHIAAGGKKQSKLRIKATTLDAYAQAHTIKRIDLIKIDVEGAEMLVLQGAKDLLKNHRITHLLIELNPHSRVYGYSGQDVVTYLKHFGYSIPKLPKKINENIVNIHAYTKH